MSGDILVRAVLSGILFGAWPLIMNRSGLPGYQSMAVFAVVQIAIMLPVGMFAGAPVGLVNWKMVLAASLMGCAALLIFMNALDRAGPGSAGITFVVMILVQICVPIVYHVLQHGGLSFRHVAGFSMAIIAAALLVL